MASLLFKEIKSFSCASPASAAVCTSLDRRSMVRPSSGRALDRHSPHLRDSRRAKSIINPKSQAPFKSKSYNQKSRRSSDQQVELISPAGSSRYLLDDSRFFDVFPELEEPAPPLLRLEPARLRTSKGSDQLALARLPSSKRSDESAVSRPSSSPPLYLCPPSPGLSEGALQRVKLKTSLESGNPMDTDHSRSWLGFSLSNHQPYLLEALSSAHPHGGRQVTEYERPGAAGLAELAVLAAVGPKMEDFLSGARGKPVGRIAGGESTDAIGIYGSELKNIAAGFLRGLPTAAEAEAPVVESRRAVDTLGQRTSIYRGVTRHHQHGRWQARIGRVAGNKDLSLSPCRTQQAPEAPSRHPHSLISQPSETSRFEVKRPS